MTTPDTKYKYYLLGFLLVLMLAAGLLLLAPDTRAQVQPGSPTVDKECTPNPVQVGQQLTCTIDVQAAPNTLAEVQVTDNLPAGLTVTGATAQLLLNGTPVPTPPCSVDGNRVTCPATPVEIFDFGKAIQTLSVTIEATAEQCGTSTNTATAEGVVIPPSAVGSQGIPSFAVEDDEGVTVVGCGGGPGGAPITQEVGQESDSGEVDLSFEVS